MIDTFIVTSHRVRDNTTKFNEYTTFLKLLLLEKGQEVELPGPRETLETEDRGGVESRLGEVNMRSGGVSSGPLKVETSEVLNTLTTEQITDKVVRT